MTIDGGLHGQTVKAGTREEAAKADVVVVAVQWQQLATALADLPAWDNRIVIDTTKPIVQPGFRDTADVSSILQKIGFATIDLGGLVSGGRLQQFPGGPLPALNLSKLS